MGEASENAGILSVVGTPIGNLRDASPRVLDTLAAADVVLCEDTRVTGRLMSAFGLHVRLERCEADYDEDGECLEVRTLETIKEARV